MGVRRSVDSASEFGLSRFSGDMSGLNHLQPKAWIPGATADLRVGGSPKFHLWDLDVPSIHHTTLGKSPASLLLFIQQMMPAATNSKVPSRNTTLKFSDNSFTFQEPSKHIGMVFLFSTFISQMRTLNEIIKLTWLTQGHVTNRDLVSLDFLPPGSR